jgi:uncharacterized protein
MITALADTSFVVAVSIATDRMHKACTAVYHQQQVIYLPQSTLAEVAYMLGREGGNSEVVEFLRRLPKSRFRLITLEPEDIARAAELLNQYADSRLDFVDASIVAIAERLQLTRILTLDSRDFTLVRPRHAEHFELLPTPAG